jgi:hypothetical protein
VDAEPYVQQILDDEGIASDLDEPEAERLLGWLIARVERWAAFHSDAAQIRAAVKADIAAARAMAKAAAAAENPANHLSCLISEYDAAHPIA